MLFPPDWHIQTQRDLFANRDASMEEALLAHLRALSVSVGRIGHPHFQNQVGYRQALEDVAAALVKEKDDGNIPG